MLPTLAERLRKQARSRRRGQTRQPWPVPGDPPTALLFRPPPAPQAHEDASPPEPVAVEVLAAESAAAAAQASAAPESAAPTPAEPKAAAEPTAAAEPPAPGAPEPRPVRTPLPEGLLLLLWALLVVIDGALALTALLRRGDSRPPGPRGTTAGAAASTAPMLCRGPDPGRVLLALSSPS